MIKMIKRSYFMTIMPINFALMPYEKKSLLCVMRLKTNIIVLYQRIFMYYQKHMNTNIGKKTSNVVMWLNDSHLVKREAKKFWQASQ